MLLLSLIKFIIDNGFHYQLLIVNEHCLGGAAMQLDKVNRGQVVRITGIPDHRTRLHAIRFGLAEGDVVTCQEVVPAGPIVVSHNKREIAIGRKLAKAILVEPLRVNQSEGV